MMECKKALQETGGDEEAAVRLLRKQGIKTQETRLGRETSAGRIAVYADVAQGAGAMIELMCESAPVAGSPDFRQLANDLAKQLATGPGAEDGRRVARTAVAIEARHDARPAEGRIVQPHARGGEGRTDCAIPTAPPAATPITTVRSAHWSKSAAATMIRPKTSPCTSPPRSPRSWRKENLDPADIDKEREILSVAARKEGKPENIIAKMIEGRLRNFFSEKVLLEQPFVKDDKQTVGQIAKKAGMTIKRFVRWELGKGVSGSSEDGSRPAPPTIPPRSC